VATVHVAVEAATVGTGAWRIAMIYKFLAASRMVFATIHSTSSFHLSLFMCPMGPPAGWIRC
jgi:hypothetical protein